MLPAKIFELVALEESLIFYHTIELLRCSTRRATTWLKINSFTSVLHRLSQNFEINAIFDSIFEVYTILLKFQPRSITFLFGRYYLRLTKCNKHLVKPRK